MWLFDTLPVCQWALNQNYLESFSLFLLFPIFWKSFVLRASIFKIKVEAVTCISQNKLVFLALHSRTLAYSLACFLSSSKKIKVRHLFRRKLLITIKGELKKKSDSPFLTSRSGWISFFFFFLNFISFSEVGTRPVASRNETETLDIEPEPLFERGGWLRSLTYEYMNKMLMDFLNEVKGIET